MKINNPFLKTIVIVPASLLLIIFVLYHEAHAVHKALVLIVFISTAITLYILDLKFLILGLLVILNINNLYKMYRSIIGHYGEIRVTTIEERRNDVYGYMQYKYIKDIVTRFSDANLFPSLYYKHYDYGVKAVIPGYRYKINNDLLMVLGLDSNLSSNDLDCSQIEKSMNLSSMRCYFKGRELPFNITGLQIEPTIFPNEVYEVIISNGDSVLANFSFSLKDIFNTVKTPNIVKISSEKVLKLNQKSIPLYSAISEKDINFSFPVDILIKGKSPPNFLISGHNKRLPSHLILTWDKDDARNYVAITKDALSSNGELISQETKNALSDIFSTTITRK